MPNKTTYARNRAEQDPEWHARKKEQMRSWRAANREKINSQKQAWYAANPDQREVDRIRARENRAAKIAADPEFYRKTRRLKKYGLVFQDIESRLSAQGNRCGICDCEITVASAKVDHDHSDGSVRGLLCQRCNLGFGHFKDDVRRLESAVRYLMRGFDEAYYRASVANRTPATQGGEVP